MLRSQVTFFSSHVTSLGQKINRPLSKYISEYNKNTAKKQNLFNVGYVAEKGDTVLFTHNSQGIARVALWSERPFGVQEAGDQSPTASHQRRKNREV